jgi:hypothetical protein
LDFLEGELLGGALRELAGLSELERQIPNGNVRQKDKGNDWLAFVVSHPFHNCGEKGRAPALVVDSARANATSKASAGSSAFDRMTNLGKWRGEKQRQRRAFVVSHP